MESDYQDNKVPIEPTTSSTSNDDIIKLLTAISSRMVTGHQELQSQLIRNDLKLETELQRVREENMQLCQDLRREFRSSMSQVPVISTSPSVIPESTTTTHVIQNSFNISPTSTSTPDFQAQMLAVLNDTFSKLSSVISDTSTVLQDTKQVLHDNKSSDSKLDWIKFSGNHKKFRSWYLAIMAQLSIAPWKDLYDPITNSVVKTTANTNLNGKLYAKVIGALEGSALQHMLSPWG
jgi:hypothetical protein